MKALFIELPAFERHRRDYLDEDAFRELQNALMVDPLAGDVIEGTGGLRKLRFYDKRRGKGKRSKRPDGKSTKAFERDDQG